MHPTSPYAPIACEDAPSFEVLPGRADSGLVLVCDHASNALPASYGALGLPRAQLQRHIAYDIGVAEVTRQLSAMLGVPAVLSRYSRLLIDLNRGEDDPTLIMRLSDGAIIPGNRHLDAAEREERIALYFRPYHDAISRVVDRCISTGHPPALLGMHSFTDVWKGAPRPWAVSILWQDDSRIALPLLRGLRDAAGGRFVVGENEPYPGQYEGDTLWRHGVQRDLAHAIVEIRQDLIGDADGQQAWAERLASLLRSAAATAGLPLRLHGPAPTSPILRTTAPGASQMRTHITVNSETDGEAPMPKIDEATRTELEAAAYRRLVEHLRTRGDVQNIDLMNLAGFCRNCLATWYQEAAATKGQPLSKDEAREIVYGMPYKEWQALNQKEASAEQQAAFEKTKPHQH